MDSMFIWILIFAGASIALLSAFLAAAEKELRRKRRELASFAVKLERSQERIKELQRAADPFALPASEHSNESRAEMEEKFAALERELAESQEKLDAFDSVHRQLLEVEQKYEKAVLDNRQLQQEISRWQERLADSEDAQRRLGILRRHMEDAQPKEEMLDGKVQKNLDLSAELRDLSASYCPPAQAEVSLHTAPSMAAAIVASEYTQAGSVELRGEYVDDGHFENKQVYVDGRPFNNENLDGESRTGSSASDHSEAGDPTDFLATAAATKATDNKAMPGVLELAARKSPASTVLLGIGIGLGLVLILLVHLFFDTSPENTVASDASSSTILPAQTGKPHSSASSFEANLLAEDDRHSPDGETPAAQDRARTPVNNELKASPAKTHANTSAPATPTNSDRPAKQEPAASQRTQSVWGAYSIVRRTQVFSEASESSAFVATIDAGTEVNVVSARNGWYEIRSKTGRPPGFIRQEHARRLR